VRDKNKIVYENDHAKIILTDKEGYVTGESLIDIEDLALVSGIKWTTSLEKHHRYATGNIKIGKNYKGIKMHRLILGVSDKSVKIDHKNHNTLDNRKENLRISSNAQNMHNMTFTRNSTSGIKGITKKGNRWECRIQLNGKRIQIGCFSSIEEALEARLKMENALYGEYANKQSTQEILNNLVTGV
jgi:hypothetical protein